MRVWRRRKGSEASKRGLNIISFSVVWNQHIIPKVKKLKLVWGEEGSETDNFIIKLWVDLGLTDEWVNVLP